MKPLDEASREIIRAGRAGQAPTSADRQRVRQKLGVAIASGLTGPAVAAPGAKAAAKWWASKLLIGAAVAVIGTAILSRSPEPSVLAVAVEPQPAVDAVALLAPPVPLQDTLDPPAPSPRPRLKPKKPAVVKEKAVDPPPLASPPPQLQPPPPMKEDTLEAETQGLREIQAALRAKEGPRALVLIEEQDRRFPLGELRPEREAAKVLSLCSSDSPASAAALEHFIERYAASPLIPRLKAACSR